MNNNNSDKLFSWPYIYLATLKQNRSLSECLYPLISVCPCLFVCYFSLTVPVYFLSAPVSLYVCFSLYVQICLFPSSSAIICLSVCFSFSIFVCLCLFYFICLYLLYNELILRPCVFFSLRLNQNLCHHFLCSPPTSVPPLCLPLLLS